MIIQKHKKKTSNKASPLILNPVTAGQIIYALSIANVQ